ncbi:hypothetical protein EAI_04267, partial [Harpegnathos saltator]
KVHKIVLADRKLKLREIADTLRISAGCVFTILHEHLSMRKLCSKWIPRLLTVNEKQQRVDDSAGCLKLFQRNKTDFLIRDIQLSGQQPAKSAQSDQKRKCQLHQLRKLCARWVPHLLTIDEKRIRMRISRARLDRFKQNQMDFKRRFITLDETWIHCLDTPERKEPS